MSAKKLKFIKNASVEKRGPVRTLMGVIGACVQKDIPIMAMKGPHAHVSVDFYISLTVKCTCRRCSANFSPIYVNKYIHA